MQALSLALTYSGMMLTSSLEFLNGQLYVWDTPTKGVFDVALPLPIDHVQSALEQLGHVLERMKAGSKVDEKWRAGLMTVLRNVEKELRLRRRQITSPPLEREHARTSARGRSRGVLPAFPLAGPHASE